MGGWGEQGGGGKESESQRGKQTEVSSETDRQSGRVKRSQQRGQGLL